METNFTQSLLLGLFLMLSPQYVQATVIYRAPGAQVSEYQEQFLQELDAITPMAKLAKDLEFGQVSTQDQEKIDALLTPTQLDIEEAKMLLRQLIERPRSRAYQSTMQMLLLRMEKDHPTKDHEFIEEFRRSITMPEKSSSWNSTPSQDFVTKKIEELRRSPGGEDVVLYINGVAWSPELQVPLHAGTQWILLSSQWRVQIQMGTAKVALHELRTRLQNWIEGTCEQSQFNGDLFDPSLNKKLVFSEGCVTSGQALTPLFPSQKTKANQSQLLNKSWFWAIGAGVLALGFSQLSGKRLVIRQ